MGNIIKCSECGEKAGWYDENMLIISMNKKGSKVEYVGRNIIAFFKCCDKNQIHKVR